MNKVYIDKSAVDYIRVEIDKVKDKDIETGGIIVGRSSKHDNITIVSHCLSGGYKAIREKYCFKKDINYSKMIENKIKAQYGFYYIGEWHTHPNNNLNYSETDRMSMIDIATENKDYLMIFIIAGNTIKIPFKMYYYDYENKKIKEIKYKIVKQIEKYLKNIL